MKRLLALVLFFNPWFASADDLQPDGQVRLPKPPEKKFYIEPTQIGFSKNQIYVNFEGDWQLVNAIYADAQGLYIRKRVLGCGERLNVFP